MGELRGVVKVLCRTCDGKKFVEYPATVCDLHIRCLPTYAPTGEAFTAWHARKPESDIYHLCRGCKDYQPQVTGDNANG